MRGFLRGVFPSQLRTLPVFSTFSDMLNRPKPGWICAIRQGVLGDVGLPCLLGLPLRLMTKTSQDSCWFCCHDDVSDAACCQLGPAAETWGREVLGNVWFVCAWCVCRVGCFYKRHTKNNLLSLRPIFAEIFFFNIYFKWSHPKKKIYFLCNPLVPIPYNKEGGKSRSGNFEDASVLFSTIILLVPSVTSGFQSICRV